MRLPSGCGAPKSRGAIPGHANHRLRRHDEREYSFADAAGFVLMRSFRMREALVF